MTNTPQFVETPAWQISEVLKEELNEETPIDREIQAYTIGAEKGITEEIKLKRNQAISNMKYLGTLTNEIKEHIESCGMEFVTAFIKPIDWFKFDILIIVDTDDYIKKKFRSVYKFMIEQEQKAQNKTNQNNDEENGGLLATFSIFSVTNGNYNIDKLESDGYILEFSYSS